MPLLRLCTAMHLYVLPCLDAHMSSRGRFHSWAGTSPATHSNAGCHVQVEQLLLGDPDNDDLQDMYQSLTEVRVEDKSAIALWK